MSGPGGLRPGFDPDELRGGDGPDPSDAELGHAWAMGRELTAAIALEGSHVEAFGFADGSAGAADPDFVARVMAAIEREPAPRAAAAVAVAGKAARIGVISASLAAFREAWRVAFGPGRTLVARAGALAYVFVALAVLGSAASVAVVGTASLLSPAGTATPAPIASQPAVGPGGTLAPGRSPAPDETGAPGVSAEPGSSGEPRETGAPGETSAPGASDDHRGRGSDGLTLGPGHTASPSPSPSGSGDSSHMPKPAPTASPTGTPKATSPGGGGGGGGGPTANPSATP